MSDIRVKICGITDAENLKVALDAGADYIGFVFVPGSPRYITPADASRLTRQNAEVIRPAGRKMTAVMANPTDQQLADVLTVFAPDIIQLHGSETVERLRDIAGTYDLRIMKAVPVSTAEDIEYARTFIGHADALLFDAKVPGQMSGGTGKTFDWHLLRGADINIPWFLSGGLTPENVAEAIRISGARYVDVSSGVESSRGVKDSERIRAFIKAAKGQ